MRTVRVAPVPGGWVVDDDLSGMPLVFRSGAQAERKAKSLASVIARQGDQAQVIVHDLQGAVAGSVVVGPGPAHRRYDP